MCNIWVVNLICILQNVEHVSQIMDERVDICAKLVGAYSNMVKSMKQSSTVLGVGA